MKGFISALSLTFLFVNVSAQYDSSKLNISFEGFVDVYYSANIADKTFDDKPSMFYNHTRNSQVDVNLAMIKLNAAKKDFRSSFGIMAGTYSNVNLASEPGVFKNIYEASIAFKPLSKHNFWIEAGIIPSHIGFESAVSHDCPTLTRSLLAENSPYYQAGLKLGYTRGNWSLNAYVLNGWQMIYKAAGNDLPSFGTQVRYTKEKVIDVNWSTFAGDDYFGTYGYRFYNDFFITIAPERKFSFTLYADHGTQYISFRNQTVSWYGFSAIPQIQFNQKFHMALRAEMMNDPDMLIFTLSGYANNINRIKAGSINFDYRINEYLKIRFETKYVKYEDAVIRYDGPSFYLIENDIFLTMAIKAQF